MKKYIRLAEAAALTIASVACLASCGESAATTTKAAETSVTDTTTAGKHFNVGVCQLVQHVALDAATEGFKASLTEAVEKAGCTITIDVQNAAGDAATCSVIANKFASSKYDLMLGNATAALQACAESSETIPVLGTSITNYGTALNLENFVDTVGGNISGTSDLAPLDKQAQMVMNVTTDVDSVGILYCSAEPNSKYQADTIKAELLKLDANVNVTYYTFSDSNDLSAVAENACANSDVVYVPTDNTAASNTEIIYAAAQTKKTPIIAGEEGICKGCGVETLSISYYDLGVKTGEMAAQILLEGADISTMKVQYADNPVYEYNAAICEEFGITPPENFVAIAE